MRVPGGCCSNGCHGYCPGSLEAPFRFTRHLLHGFNLIFIKGILKKVELSYPRLQRNQHSGSCIGMSEIGLQLASDEELLGFQHHSQPKHENTFVICKVESGFNTTSQQLTLSNY